MVYRSVVSPNGTDSGFLNHSLAVFNVSHFPEGSKPTYSNLFENITLCRYTEYRNPPDHIDMPYKRPTIYWHILAFRLAFVVVFQVGLYHIFTKYKVYKHLLKLFSNYSIDFLKNKKIVF